MDAETSSNHLALPPPQNDSGSKTLSVNHTIALDELGPMVVNSDGTLSRISNWNGLTKEEQERTVRVLGARNRLRMEKEEKKQLQSSEKDDNDS